MGWSVWSVNTVTGVKQNKLPVSSFPWGTALNSGKSGSATVLLNDATVKDLDVRALTTPIARTLVLCWDETPQYAGIIWDRVYDRAGGTLTIRHSDLWSILDKRHVTATFDQNVATNAPLTYASVTMATLVRRVMEAGTARGALPLTFAGVAAGSESRTYYGYHLKTVKAALEELMNGAGGPDLDFRPRWHPTTGNFDWLVTTATTPGGSDHSEFHLGAGNTAAFGIKIREDASALMNSVLAVGEGSEKNMLARAATDGASPYPLVEGLSQGKQQPDLDLLQAQANGDLATFKKPTEQWEMNIHAGEAQRITLFQLGRNIRIHSQGDPWIPDGLSVHRLIEMSGTAPSEQVNFQFQPTGA
jgi:hypothetical protein